MDKIEIIRRHLTIKRDTHEIEPITALTLIDSIDVFNIYLVKYKINTITSIKNTNG